MPNSLLQKIPEETLIYSVGYFANILSFFFLIPFYAREFGVDGFGVYSLAKLLPSFLIVILTLNIPGSVIRFYLEWEKLGVEKKGVFTLFLVTFSYGLCFTALLLLWGEDVFSLIFKLVDFDPYIKIALIAEALTIPSLLSTKLMRIKGEPRIFSSLSFIIAILNFIVGYFMVVVYGQGILGALYASLYVNLVGLLLHMVYLFKNFEFGFNSKIFKETAKYSFPTVPGTIMTSTAGVLDRFLLDKFVTASEFGIYAIAKTIINALTSMFGLFQFSVYPSIIRVAFEKDDAPKIIGNLFQFFVKIIISVLVGVFLFSREIILLIGGAGFEGSILLLQLLLVDLFFVSTAVLPVAQINIAKRNIYESFAAGIKLTMFIVLGIAATQYFGVLGMLLSLVVSNFITTIYLYWKGQSLYKVEFLFSKVKIIFILTMLSIGWYNFFIKDINLVSVGFGYSLMVFVVFIIISWYEIIKKFISTVNPN